ncbi:hypothetical protein [Bifidobacterium gallicum]|uniref:Multidrug resistance protein EbrB n=1 Tax=Bifidobacterium gallicum DSM 20093 = LMG 11596 TaxID=561180 RepID=D1NVQ6_9BIFI|nr:hypothetical protein [Bifidobacterium gallicum]EFA22907.1 hypothetical protein BIFGAL_03948 [Bifidobacterium gallicum DSM 20093 = LMG 11596]KFI59394.1 multidrug resistance protein EbrB [Bifidobacterium gallicum DSM 20093 = LMG 11596]
MKKKWIADNDGPRSFWPIIAVIVNIAFILLGLSELVGDSSAVWAKQMNVGTWLLIAVLGFGFSGVAVAATGPKRKESGRLMAWIAVLLAVISTVIYGVALYVMKSRFGL